MLKRTIDDKELRSLKDHRRADLLRDIPTALDRGGKCSQTILVVEDEAPNLRLVSLFLEKQGYRVLQARDGLEAIV